jgi:integrase
MYGLISYNAQENNKQCWTVLNQSLGITPTYAIIYSTFKLSKRATATQRRHMTAICQFYEYLYLKHNDSFETIFKSNGLRGLIHELDGFSAYLDTGRKGVNIVAFIVTDDDNNVETSRVRIEDLFIFLRYLNNRYTTAKYDNTFTTKGIAREQTAINFLLRDKRDDLTSSASKRKISAVNEEYKSLTPFQCTAFLETIYPSTPKKENEKNPFSTMVISFRNYLICTLALDYGLRRGEINLLETDSFKPALHNLDGITTYYIVVTNCEGEGEAEGRIKTDDSHRTLKITEEHYHLLCHYVNQFRLKRIKHPDGSEETEECDSSILFLSSQKPKALTLRMFNKIFTTLTKALHQHFPDDIANPKSMEYLRSLFPHLLRHTWAVAQLHHLVNELGMSITDAKDLLRINGGWSIKSVMPDHYGRRFLADTANAANLRHILQGNDNASS